jgi:hypothetical protein
VREREGKKISYPKHEDMMTGDFPHALPFSGSFLGSACGCDHRTKMAPQGPRMAPQTDVMWASQNHKRTIWGWFIGPISECFWNWFVIGFTKLTLAMFIHFFSHP